MRRKTVSSNLGFATLETSLLLGVGLPLECSAMLRALRHSQEHSEAFMIFGTITLNICLAYESFLLSHIMFIIENP